MVLLVTTIVIALAFDYTNAFHDTANAIATCGAGGRRHRIPSQPLDGRSFVHLRLAPTKSSPTAKG